MTTRRLKPSILSAAVAAIIFLSTLQARAEHSFQLEEASSKDPVALVQGAMGTDSGALIWGRAVTAKGLELGHPNEGMWKKFRRSFRIFTPHKLRSQAVTVEIFNKKTGQVESHRVLTDAHGNFELKLEKTELAALGVGQHAIAAKVEGSPYGVSSSEGTLRVYPGKGTLVVSDIDDTVLDTRVNQKARMLGKVVFSNAHDMRTFTGASTLFQAFAEQGFPTVFVTSSPSNLDTRMGAFLELNEFPAKLPLLMKTLGKDKFSGDHDAYKLGQLAKVVKLFKNYDVVAIGDSGQADQRIYQTLRQQLGDERVRFVAIRRVPPKTLSGMRKWARSLARRIGCKASTRDAESTPAKSTPRQFVFSHYAEAHQAMQAARILPRAESRRSRFPRSIRGVEPRPASSHR